MDQPHPDAALGREPVRTIGRDAIKPDDEVVVYCSHVDCLSSVALYRDLVRRGYRNVRRYSGGLLDWEDAGLPLDGTFATAR